MMCKQLGWLAKCMHCAIMCPMCFTSFPLHISPSIFHYLLSFSLSHWLARCIINEIDYADAPHKLILQRQLLLRRGRIRLTILRLLEGLREVHVAPRVLHKQPVKTHTVGWGACTYCNEMRWSPLLIGYTNCNAHACTHSS